MYSADQNVVATWSNSAGSCSPGFSSCSMLSGCFSAASTRSLLRTEFRIGKKSKLRFLDSSTILFTRDSILSLPGSYAGPFKAYPTNYLNCQRFTQLIRSRLTCSLRSNWLLLWTYPFFKVYLAVVLNHLRISRLMSWSVFTLIMRWIFQCLPPFLRYNPFKASLIWTRPFQGLPDCGSDPLVSWSSVECPLGTRSL